MTSTISQKFTGTPLYFQIIFWGHIVAGSGVLLGFFSFNLPLLLALSIMVFYGIFLFSTPGYIFYKNKAKYAALSILLTAIAIIIWYFFLPEGVYTATAYFVYIAVAAIFAGSLSNSPSTQNTVDNFELNMLKSQFNPHFLFNTLNIIYGKCHTTSPEAANMIQNLSAFMRYLINDCSKDKVLLQKEITMIHDYISLYKLNYTDNLDITFIHKLYDPMQKVAPMLLLNFVENAFKHSHIAVKDNAFVKIELATDQAHLHFKVVNSKASVINRLEKGIGNSLTLKQLELMYKGRYEYTVTDGEKEYEAFLKIKL